MSHVKFKEVLVTPEYAMRMLQGVETYDFTNRTLNCRQVARLSGAMKDGRYNSHNGETCKVTSEGVLVDGQHRFRAVVESGVAVPMTIAFGVDLDAVNTIDDGYKRSGGDTLLIRMGLPNPKLVAAIARLAVSYATDPEGGSPLVSRILREVVDNDLIHTFVIGDLSVVTTASKLIKTVPASLVRSRSLAGFAWWAYAQVDEVAADSFFQRFGKGVSLTEREPAYVLRERFLREGPAGVHRDRARQLFYLFRAMKADYEGETITRLHMPPGGQPTLPSISVAGVV